MIAVLGCMDTKGTEFKYLIELIRSRGHDVLILDTSVMGSSPLAVDVAPTRVAAAAGSDLADLRQRGDRGFAIEVMALGAATLVSQLHAEGRINGVIGMGGSAAASIFAAVTRSLPIGFPKVLVTTLASGDTRNLVGTKDLVLIPAVVDIAGLNRISRRILGLAAGAICGMVEAHPASASGDRPIIAASMLGNTTQAIGIARQIFEEAGYEVLVFHAIGSGGKTLISLINDSWVNAVYDLTTTELASELVGAPTGAGADRLLAAGQAGLPTVIFPGCMDFSIFWTHEGVPSRFNGRMFYSWNPQATLMRTNPEECAYLGRQIAEAANNALGPVAVFLPLKGLSLLDIEGGPFWWPAADQALFDAVRQHIKPNVPLIEMNEHINSPVMARQAAATLLGFLSS